MDLNNKRKNSFDHIPVMLFVKIVCNCMTNIYVWRIHVMFGLTLNRLGPHDFPRNLAPAFTHSFNERPKNEAKQKDN